MSRAIAAGCVLANDPAGDAQSFPVGVHNSAYDLEKISAEVTRQGLVFRIKIGKVPARPLSPTTAHYWRLWFQAPEGPLQVTVVRDFYGDQASAAVGAPPVRSVNLEHRIDARANVLMAVLPHTELGFPDGTELVGDRADSGPVTGVWLPPVGGDRQSVGTSQSEDRTVLGRRLVVARGCR